MDLKEDIRDAWLAAGWKRGAFIRLDSNPHLADELPRKLLSLIDGKESVCIVPILYDCALIEECFEKEPWAQVLVIWKTDFNNTFAYAKNPRRLHLKAKSGDQEICFEIAAVSFAQVDREALLKATPDTSLSWETGCLNLMLDWVAERYRQATFPDAFNKRLAPSRKALERLWKSDSFSLYSSGVYIKLNTFEELPDNTLYEVSVYIAIPYQFKGAEYKDIEKNHSPTMVTQLKSIFDAIENIQLDSIDTLSEREFTKEIERGFNRFSLEYFSYRSGLENKPLPAEYKGA